MAVFKKIALGGDHAGFTYKSSIAELLASAGLEVDDKGPHSGESVDYPDFVHPVAHAITSGESDGGIVICGSGNGVSMTANKHINIRAALCWTEELAALARQHNDANVLALPARFIDLDKAKAIVDIFINTDFEGGRHERRVNKINI